MLLIGINVSVFLQSTDERNLYHCIMNGLWGSKNNKLHNWHTGDTVIVYVDRALAAVFTVANDTFYDESPIWPGDTYPYRVELNLHKIVHPEHRYSLSNDDSRQVLYKHHSKAYGVSVVLTANPIHPEVAGLLLDRIENSPDWNDFDVEYELMQIEQSLELENEEVAEKVVEARSEETPEAPPRQNTHTEIQLYLAKLGRALNFDIWIPKPDQGREHNGVALGSLSIQQMPEMPFNREVNRIISYIDVIWLQDDHPAHLFEVEHTTSVYSGILRMSDLVTVIPSLDIGMFICASEERRAKVRAEVARPTFNKGKLPLSTRCRFIPFESLSDFMEEYDQGSSSLQHIDTVGII